MAVIAKRLADGGFADASAMTVTGRTFGEEAADAKETAGQEVIRALSDPIKLSGGLVILKGNLAPEGCVIKVTGIERNSQRGPARVFDCGEEDAMAAVTGGKINVGDVLVILLRRAARRAGDEGDARRDGRDCGRGIVGERRAADGWPI